MPPKPKIIYIAGSGRSGSTILSLLVTQHPQVTNLGQIRDVFLARSKGAVCSCGAELAQCPFWAPILHRRPQEVRRLGQLARPDVLDVYHTATALAGTPVCVDSSKSVDLCHLLYEATDIDLYCLNLVRDPRAVAASWSKVLRDPELLRKRCRNWVGRQKRIEHLGQVCARNYLQLRYEDFVRAPRASLALIQSWAGLERDLSAFDTATDARLSWRGQHLFAPANEAVLTERATRIKIAEARAWKAPDCAPVRALAAELCFPFAQRYGYRLEESS